MEKPKKPKNPKEWMDQITEKEKQEILDKILEGSREAIENERREKKVDEVWKRVSNCAGKYIAKCMKAGGYENNSLMNTRGIAAKIKRKVERNIK